MGCGASKPEVSPQEAGAQAPVPAVAVPVIDDSTSASKVAGTTSAEPVASAVPSAPPMSPSFAAASAAPLAVVHAPPPGSPLQIRPPAPLGSSAAQLEGSSRYEELRRRRAGIINQVQRLAGGFLLFGQAMPVIGHVCEGLREILISVEEHQEQAEYVFEAVEKMATFLTSLKLMAENVEKYERGNRKVVQKAMENLNDLVLDYQAAFVAFEENGQLKRAWTQRGHVEALTKLDKEITECLEHLDRDYGLVRDADQIKHNRKVEQQNDIIIAQQAELLRRLSDANMDENQKVGVGASVRMISQQSAEVQPVLTKAAGHLIDGDANAATAVLEEAPEEMKEEAAVLFAGGLAHQQLRDVPAAIKSYQLAVKKDPQMKDALFMLYLAFCQENGGRHNEKALKTLDKCIEIKPSSLDASDRPLFLKLQSLAYAMRGLALREMKRGSPAYEEAEGMFRKAIALDPNYPLAHYHLAVLLQEVRKDVDSAEEGYRAAIDCNPSDQSARKRMQPKAHLCLAYLLMVKGDMEGAEEHFSRHIELEPTPLHATYFALGRILQKRKDFDGAEAAFLQASRLDPENAEYRQLCAEMRRKITQAERKSKKNAKKNSKKSPKKK